MSFKVVDYNLSFLGNEAIVSIKSCLVGVKIEKIENEREKKGEKNGYKVCLVRRERGERKW